MANIPTITINEETEPMFPRGEGAEAIVVIGDAGFTKDLTTLFQFSSYEEARQDHATNAEAIGPEPENWDSNPVLKAVRDIFNEGAKREVTDELGINKVYAINIGSSPAAEDYADAMELAAQQLDIVHELYPDVTSATTCNAIGANLDALELVGQYRFGYATTAGTESVDDLTKITDPEEVTHVDINSRLYIHADPEMLATFVAKVACTQYYEDPARGKYRSKTKEDIVLRPNTDLDTIVAAGLVVDWVCGSPIATSDNAEPCMAVSTSYREVDGEQAVDGLMHIRRNVDYQARTVEAILVRQLKARNTAAARHVAEQDAIAHLENEVRNQRIESYGLNVEIDPADPFGIISNFSCRPKGATYSITVNRVIQAPTGGD